MSEIEFLETAGEAPRGPAAEPAGRGARPAFGSGAALAAAAALAASALCVAAAFQRLYTLTFGTGTGTVHIFVDARGHYTGSGAGGGSLQHAPDYAAPLWLCAALFAVLAVLCAASAVGKRHRHLRAATLGVGTAGAGLLAGLLLAAWQEVQATFDSVRATLRFSAENGDPVNGRLATTFGPCLILAVAALVLAAAATVVVLLVRRRRRIVDVALPPDPAADAALDAASEDDAADEELVT